MQSRPHWHWRCLDVRSSLPAPPAVVRLAPLPLPLPSPAPELEEWRADRPREMRPPRLQLLQGEQSPAWRALALRGRSLGPMNALLSELPRR